MSSVVTVNGVDAVTYKAILMDYEIGAYEFNDSYILPAKSIFPKKYKGDVGLRKIAIVFDFECEDENEATTMISNFTAAIRQGADILLPDGFYYNCVLDGISKPNMVAPWILQCTFSFSGYRHGALVTATITQTSNITVTGNYPTEAKLTITTTDASVTVAGITISNASGTTIIDGIEKKVTRSGANVFADTNMTEFPKLNPGVNSIAITGAATVVIEYYPIFY